jgi:hypothetical protein
MDHGFLYKLLSINTYKTAFVSRVVFPVVDKYKL